jgi:5-methyltetrahydrofolate--homocysteine methyltransferase
MTASLKTIVSSAKRTLEISRDQPTVIIGERINPTGRKRVLEALKDGDFDQIRQDALQQVEAGAKMLDVNAGVPGADQPSMLQQVMRVVMEVVDVPLSIDTADPESLKAALSIYDGKALVNSVNGEEESLSAVLPLVKEYGAAVIGLCMDDDGIPNEAETRLRIAGRIIERAAQLGIPAEDIIIDPLVLTVGADSQAAAVTLKTIELITSEFGVNINLGASNVSFGLPDRHTVNQVFLALAIGVGATCAITDPLKLTQSIRAADLLLGRDNYGSRYIGYWRSQQQKEGT